MPPYSGRLPGAANPATARATPLAPQASDELGANCSRHTEPRSTGYAPYHGASMNVPLAPVHQPHRARGSGPLGPVARAPTAFGRAVAGHEAPERVVGDALGAHAAEIPRPARGSSRPPAGRASGSWPLPPRRNSRSPGLSRVSGAIPKDGGERVTGGLSAGQGEPPCRRSRRRTGRLPAARPSTRWDRRAPSAPAGR